MKTMVITLIAVFYLGMAEAQTFAEFFAQKKTQKKYLLQQIAATQVYIEFAQKGYAIAQNGLTVVGDLKRGELDLHSMFFNSLKSVNPKIKNYGKVTDIVQLQLQVVKIYKDAMPALKNEALLSSEESSYISNVFAKLLDGCASTTLELLDIITSGKYEMTDDERLRRIELLYQDMQKKYAFSKAFSSSALMLARSREKDKNDAYATSKAYGL